MIERERERERDGDRERERVREIETGIERERENEWWTKRVRRMRVEMRGGERGNAKYEKI